MKMEMQGFAFCVNGVKIFARGADYIPEDCIYQDITKEKIQNLLQTAKDCGFNCILVQSLCDSYEF